MTKATEKARRPRLRGPRFTRAIPVLAVALVVSLALFKHIVSLRTTAPARESFHGPWIYGNPAARFTIIEYADLECPYCRAYFPVLRHWIDEHREVNWEWRNLPLAMHEPAALREALLAECAGEVSGNQGFWRAAAWIYAHTRGEGAGIPEGMRMPGMSQAIRGCLGTGKAREVIRAQVLAAAHAHILGTPTLKLVDLETQRSLELPGPARGDILLSGIDALAALPTRPDSGGGGHNSRSSAKSAEWSAKDRSDPKRKSGIRPFSGEAIPALPLQQAIRAHQPYELRSVVPFGYRSSTHPPSPNDAALGPAWTWALHQTRMPNQSPPVASSRAPRARAGLKCARTSYAI